MLIILTTCLNLSNQTRKFFWKTANCILHRSPPSPPHSSSEAINLVNTFSSFFKKKIALIHKILPTSILRCTDPILPNNRIPLSYFSFVSVEEVSRLIRSLPNKSSLLDLIPTSLFKTLFSPLCSNNFQTYQLVFFTSNMPPLKQHKFSFCLRKAIWILPFLRTTVLFLT